MPRNFDTTTQKPYPRISGVHISYPTSGMPLLTYTERDAIVDADGIVHFIDNGERQCSVEIDMAKRDEPIQLVNPATGAAIPGAFTNIKQIIMVITAMIRADQAKRDVVS
jgi:hypothetical protein